MRDTFFSIIIPTYNSAESIDRCLQSILTQSFEDFEVLVIDGESNDATLSIVSSKMDNRIEIMVGSDSGVYDAMNKGIERARGKWLYFIGSDDFLFDRDVLKDVNTQVIQNDAHFLYGNVFHEGFKKAYDGEFTLEKILDRNICHQATFVSRRTFDEVGNFNASYKICADWDFNMRCFFNKAVRKMYVDRTIAHFSFGGVSSRTKVDEFVKNRKRLIVQYGAGVLPESILKRFYPSRIQYWRDRIKRFFAHKRVTTL